jgi:hypothetical protein
VVIVAVAMLVELMVSEVSMEVMEVLVAMEDTAVGEAKEVGRAASAVSKGVQEGLLGGRVVDEWVGRLVCVAAAQMVAATVVAATATVMGQSVLTGASLGAVVED